MTICYPSEFLKKIINLWTAEQRKKLCMHLTANSPIYYNSLSLDWRNIKCTVHKHTTIYPNWLISFNEKRYNLNDFSFKLIFDVSPKHSTCFFYFYMFLSTELHIYIYAHTYEKENWRNMVGAIDFILFANIF